MSIHESLLRYHSVLLILKLFHTSYYLTYQISFRARTVGHTKDTKIRHGSMRLYTNMLGRSQHRASRSNRVLERRISMLSYPVPGKLPYLFDMTWSSIWLYTGVGGREENNVVTLKETNSNEESGSPCKRRTCLDSRSADNGHTVLRHQCILSTMVSRLTVSVVK